MQALEIAIAQVRVALTDIVDGLVHPVALIFLSGLENATAVDMTEEFVACAIEKLLFRQICPRFVADSRACGQHALSYSLL